MGPDQLWQGPPLPTLSWLHWVKSDIKGLFPTRKSRSERAVAALTMSPALLPALLGLTLVLPRE